MTVPPEGTHDLSVPCVIVQTSPETVYFVTLYLCVLSFGCQRLPIPETPKDLHCV